MIDAANIAASTRIRLARNIEGYPFPSHLKEEKQARDIIRLVTTGLTRLDEFDFRIHYMDNISESEALSLKENHLISPNLINNRRIAAALINNDKSISIMINEEDHLREQCIVKGLDLRLAYRTLSRLDNRLASSMKFAYDEQFGFLTACPSNLGTGLRASVMMFLPAITINGHVPRIIEYMKELGLTVRGIYGEGSRAEGYMYQVSNEVTLGLTEEEILRRVEEVVSTVCKIEKHDRENLKNCISALDIKDDCLRSYGILTNCAKLSTAELIKYSSGVKLGACLGYIKIDDISAVDDIVVKMRPSNINEAAGRELTPTERDVYRAEYTGKYLKKLLSENK